jgi:outer membrane protein assembly factor BamD
MNLFIRLFIILLVILPTACNKKKQELVDPIKDTSLDLQMIEAYKKGLEELEKGQALIAAKKFNEAEMLFPQSQWAPRSALMSAYSYFDFGYYAESIDEVNRFLKTYPNSGRKNYAYYLKAMSYYNQIVDEKKDLGPIIEAKESFQLIILQYPNSEYAMDAEFKLELIEEILAAKEMYIGRFYLKKEKWIPAINRFKKVVEDYETTIFAEEALHRLVEVYYKIGLVEESKKYAITLGYNYQSGEWYENSYQVFNKNYKKIRKKKQDKKSKSLIKKIRSIIVNDNE